MNFISIGKFIRLLDEEGNLSITNVAAIAILAKVVTSPTVEVESLIAFSLTLLNYGHKRAVKGKKNEKKL